MVSWWGNGNISGYHYASRQTELTHDYFQIGRFWTSPVDAQIPTRLDRYRVWRAPSDSVVNPSVWATARIEFTGMEVWTQADAGFSHFGVTAFFAPDDPALYRNGVVDPVRIRDFVRQGWGLAKRSTWLWQTELSSQQHTFYTAGVTGPELFARHNVEKWWVLVVPTRHRSGNPKNDPRMDEAVNGASPGDVAASQGRAISFYVNRRPNPPVILNLPQGHIRQAGEYSDIGFTVTDPDRDVTDTSAAAADRAGVQFQYAPRLTEGGAPEWVDIPVDDGVGGRDPGWHIWGASRGSSILSGTNLGSAPGVIRLHYGTITTPATYPTVANMVLPPGEWQVRMRVFDFGHPMPGVGYPVGNSSATMVNVRPDTYPVSNTSVWSDPIAVTVETQNYPPTLLNPINNTAVVEGPDVTFRWMFRNSGEFTQAGREVEFRKVGDPTWTQLVLDSSADQFLVRSTVDEVIFDEQDNSGTTDWSKLHTSQSTFSDPDSSTTGGQKAISTSLVGTSSETNGVVSLIRSNLSGVSGNKVTVEGFFAVQEQASPPSGKNIRVSLTSGLTVVASTTLSESGTDATGDPDIVSGFYSVELEADADFEGVQVSLQGDFTSPPGEITLGVSNLQIASSSQVLDIEAGNQYEWRARTKDSSGDSQYEWSDWSEAARFWVVPPANSAGNMPVPSETSEGATLGCGTHRVFVYRRGGVIPVGEITEISHVDWNRKRDDISTAKIIVSGWSLDCGNLISMIKTLAYEIVIFRDNGYSVDRVWEGPITLLQYEADRVTIHAKDVMFHPYRRIMREAMSDAGEGTNVVNRAVRILQTALAPDDPNVLAYLQPNTADAPMQYRSVPAYGRTAFEEIDDMASNAGLDYTVVGRAILLWGTRNALGTLPEFRDQDLGSTPVVSEYGMSFANYYAVSDGNGLWGAANRLDEDGKDETFGLVEMLSSSWASNDSTDASTFTESARAKAIESFEGFAERSIADRYPPPVIVRLPENTTLNSSAVVSIRHLVPGVAIPLRSTGTLRSVVGRQKLDSVTVVEEGGVETISISMSPFNQRDDEVEAEE